MMKLKYIVINLLWAGNHWLHTPTMKIFNHKIILPGIMFLLGLLMATSCKQTSEPIQDVWNFALEKKSTLRLSVYVTAHAVEKMFTTEVGKREVISLLRANGITKVYVEVYRSGLAVSPETLKTSVAFLKDNGFEVVGGIATVPGTNFGVHQNNAFSWFNWQNPKTQNDLRKVMEDAAPIFDSFIVDDFLCTSDSSQESRTAKGDRSWSAYRRSLLSELSESVFIRPAREKNPSIKMIIKYPQWYDRYHLFGYDVATQPALFDSVWIGTETRGQYTQRFGFVQPYQGFINYRWMSSLSGSKMGGAWFDHGDCDELDFIDQAYQTVLAGAKELVIFEFGSFLSGHPGHHLLRQDFEKLVDLAQVVASNPVQGVVGYKPPNSDAGSDLYLMDYIGMFGVSLVPDSKYPENAKVIFLPTQAAADKDIAEKIMKSLDQGAKIIITTGFLTNVSSGEKLAARAQIKWPLANKSVTTQTVISEGREYGLKIPISMDYEIIPDGANVLLQAVTKSSDPFLVQNQKGNISVINTHTFSQKDFEAVGEVLLSPRPLGMLEFPRPCVNTIRAAFQSDGKPGVDAPARVSIQQLSNGDLVIHNYNQELVVVTIQKQQAGELMDGLTGESIRLVDNAIKLEMAPRSRKWIRATSRQK